jgi:hypothetical protein
LKGKYISETKDTVVKCKGTSVVTMTTVTSSSSVVTVLESPSGHDQFKPVASTGIYISQLSNLIKRKRNGEY